jgi:hypothetical protein
MERLLLSLYMEVWVRMWGWWPDSKCRMSIVPELRAPGRGGGNRDTTAVKEG